MAPRIVSSPAASITAAAVSASSVSASAVPVSSAPAASAITPDLASVLADARPHPQLGAALPKRPSTAALGGAAAAIAADLALRPDADEALAGLHTSYLLPPGTRARVHRAGPAGVLLLAPSDAPRAVAAAGPGIYVVVESSL